MNSGIRARSAGVRRHALISIPDETRHPRGIFALPTQLVIPLGHQDRIVLLVTQPGALFADHQEGSLAGLVAEHLGRGCGKGMGVAGQFAQSDHHPVILARDRLGTGRNVIDSAQQDVTLAILTWHRGVFSLLGAHDLHPSPISAAWTSFNEARISQSGLRRANAAAKAQRSILYFLLKASAPIRCCSSW